MAVTTITNRLFETMELWNRRGVPIEVWLGTGEFWRMIKKNMEPDWYGEGIMKVPLNVAFDGNIGSGYQRVFANHQPVTGYQFQVPVRETWTTVQMDWKFLALTNSAKALVSALQGKQNEMLAKVKAYMKHMSYTAWGDGTGRIAKGDGAFNVAGNTVTLLNRQCIHRFEKGDVLVLIDQAAAVPSGGQPTPRAGTVTVAAVNRQTGSLQMTGNINAGIAAAVNTDYIGKKVDFPDGGDDASSGPLDGYFRYVPITNTEAITTLFNVTRADDVQRLSGDRVTLTGTESPWQIVTTIARRAKENDAPITHIFVPSHEIEELSAEMASRLEVTTMASNGNVGSLTMGYKSMKVLIPGMDREVEIIADKYMCDIELTEANDRTYVGLTLPHLRVPGADGGYKWVNFSGEGTLNQTVGRQIVSGSYGAFSNLVHDAPGHDVIASTRAAL